MKRTLAGLAVAGAAVFMLGGCGWGNRTEGDEPAGSGNPEADQRAELHVGSGEGKKDSKEGAKEKATLYERLGGEEGVRRLVDDMTERVVNDPRVNFARHDVRSGVLRRKYDPWDATPQNQEHFKARMIEFISLAAGGPANYNGRDMGSLHKGMRISNSEFDAMIGDIKTSMDRLSVARQEQKEVLAIFETTRKEIVEEK